MSENTDVRFSLLERAMISKPTSIKQIEVYLNWTNSSIRVPRPLKNYVNRILVIFYPSITLISKSKQSSQKLYVNIGTPIFIIIIISTV